MIIRSKENQEVIYGEADKYPIDPNEVIEVYQYDPEDAVFDEPIDDIIKSFEGLDKLPTLNISDDSLLNYQDNIFYSFCIYEFYLSCSGVSYDMNFMSNRFNSDFFNLSNILKLGEKIKKIDLSKNYLSDILYEETVDKFKSIKESINDYYNEMFDEDYNELSLLKQNVNINKLDYYSNMMSIRSFMIKIPYAFFLWYTWYIIFYRNARYNLYVRSILFFEEYTSKKNYFILHNNPYGKNRTKITFFNFQKLWTVNHFKLYIEERFFNKWFLFYSSRFKYLKNFMTNDYLDNKYSFNSILNDNNLNLLLKINKSEQFYDSIEFRYIYEFYYDNLLDFVNSRRNTNGFKLMMRTRQSKFSKRFRLGLGKFYGFKAIIDAMYTLPYDLVFFYKSMNNFLSFDLLLDLYNEKFIDYYLLKDFYNFNNKIDYIKNTKIINFYNKLKYLSFYIIDPFFLKFLWTHSFPRKLKNISRLSEYLSFNLVQRGIRRVKRLNVFNYDFFHHYLNWRTDTSTFSLVNNFYKDSMSAFLSLSNIIVKSRFLNLLYKVKFTLNLNNLFIMHKIQRFVLLMKDFYFQLLDENIDTLLYMFLLNIKKCIILQNNIWSHMSTIIDYNFLYRYYVYHFLFEYNYYVNWAHNNKQTALWIFHKKDYREHEGLLFYKDQYIKMF